MKNFKKSFVFLLVSYIIVIAVNLTANYQYYKAGNDWHFSVFFSMGIATFCWLWFGLLNNLVFRKFNWHDRPTLKIILASLIFAAQGAGMMLVIMKVLVLWFNMTGQTTYDYINNSAYAALISMIIGLMVTGQRTLTALKQHIADNERMKQEMVQSQYETLKSQVNPHFLFNSLNTLTVMIPEEPVVAVKFVEQMSKVFRYSLQHSGENTIDVGTELKVVQSYLFLNEQRYDGKLIATLNVADAALHKKIITQSLLMLVENAVKHNEISHENPLSIDVYDEGGYLVVRNTLQRRTLAEQSTRVGLENIKSRYALATKLPVTIEEANEWFTVKIPLLS